MAQEQPLAKQRLVYSILKFLEKEIQTESSNGERRESIEVAVQCLETSFDVSLANPSNDLTYGPPIDLLSIVSNKSSINTPLTDDMRQQADRLKNQGNEYVKHEKYKEALEAYNAAIQIDANNAIYYCNRAAAHNKLNNNEQALNDCFRSIEIDPNYSKAYGRLGVIYLSLDKVHEALDAYKKAHALEPNNENYKQSIKLCEDRLNAAANGASPGPPGGQNFASMFGSLLGGASGGPDMMSLLNNPALMNMASQFVQNPQVQGLMANLVTNLGGQEGGQVGLESLLQTGQRMASELSANNPDLIESLRRNMGNRPPTGNNPSSSSSHND
jgi:small glutamine-rich tetratricopeptide repeat-containing protein alpha